MLSAKIAVNVLHVRSACPSLRQETNILLPSVTLAVLRECSGVNQLIALTAMVLPAAYLWLDTNARRVALILFSVVVSYLGNGLRIALVGWLAVKGLGDGDLNGSYHLLQGLGVSRPRISRHRCMLLTALDIETDGPAATGRCAARHCRQPCPRRCRDGASGWMLPSSSSCWARARLDCRPRSSTSI